MKHLIIPIVAIIVLSFTNPKPPTFEQDFFAYVDAVENYQDVKTNGGNLTAAGDLVWEKAQAVKAYPDGEQRFAQIVGNGPLINYVNCILYCSWAGIGCLKARINVDMCDALMGGCGQVCDLQYPH